MSHYQIYLFLLKQGVLNSKQMSDGLSVPDKDNLFFKLKISFKKT